MIESSMYVCTYVCAYYVHDRELIAFLYFCIKESLLSPTGVYKDQNPKYSGLFVCMYLFYPNLEAQ